MGLYLRGGQRKLRPGLVLFPWSNFFHNWRQKRQNLCTLKLRLNCLFHLTSCGFGFQGNALESLPTGGTRMIILLSAKGTCPTQHDKVIHFGRFFLFCFYSYFYLWLEMNRKARRNLHKTCSKWIFQRKAWHKNETKENRQVYFNLQK